MRSQCPVSVQALSASAQCQLSVPALSANSQCQLSVPALSASSQCQLNSQCQLSYPWLSHACPLHNALTRASLRSPALALGSGIQFSRTVTSIASDSDFQLKFDAGCTSSDDYGSNDCSFAWGDDISGSVGGDLGHDLEEGSTFSVDVKVDKLVSWKFSCAACGANCTTTIPVVGEDVNFAMPDCPVPATAVPATVFEQLLPADSPTKGVKVTVSGTVGVKDSKGADVIALKIDATVQ